MVRSTRKAALKSAAYLPLFALMGTSAAYAKDTAPDTTADASSPDDDGNIIIVTGSRIAQQLVTASNPVTMVTAENIQQAGTSNLTDYLKTVPALVGSSSSFDNSGDRASIGTTGLNLPNLRNLGFNRTLTLIDGKRHVASVEGMQSVDVNTIPSDLIERVEVFTGGASAVYGADGVSGVVNFIQKKNFEGITIRAQNGISEHGDAGQRLIALTAGHNFADGRGNFAIAWEHGEEDRLEASQRSRLRGGNRVGFFLNPNPAPGAPQYVPLDDVRYFGTSRQGAIDVDFDFVPDFYGANGTPYDIGTPIPGFQYQQGGSGTLISDFNNELLPEINRDIVNATGHFEISPAFEIYGEAKYANTQSYSLSQPSFHSFLLVMGYNPFIPANLVGAPALLVNRDHFDLGIRGEDIDRETIRTVIGARGELSDHLKYDVSYVFGQTKITNHHINDILTDRFFAAIDAIDIGRGPTCMANLNPAWTSTQLAYAPVTATTFAPGECIPFNLFGDGVNNQAAIDWLKADTTDHSKLTQHVISGALSGDTGGFLELPGGPIGFALGGEYREEHSSFTPDPLIQQGLTFVGALGNSSGKFHVTEFFGETLLPVLKDEPFAYRLDLNAAIRLSDYSTIGSTTAWKIGGNWAPVRDVTFRGSYSTAVRAPNISELYGATSQTGALINDPCNATNLQNGTQYRTANCQALLSGLGVGNPAVFIGNGNPMLGLAGSNPDLREEKAKTWTAGVVLQPDFIPRLTISADWYNIRIDSAINTASAEQLAALCVDQPTLDNQYCDQIVRSDGSVLPAGYITGFNLKPFNVANFKTAGLDVTLAYSIPTTKAGTFNIRLQGNYLDKLSYVPIPGATAINTAYVGGSENGITSPKYQITTDLSWSKGPAMVNYRISYFSRTYRFDRQTVASNPDVTAPEYMKLKERFVNDVYASYDVSDQFQIYGGVNNLFDQKPALGELSFPVSAVGRFFYIGAKVKLADIFE